MLQRKWHGGDVPLSVLVAPESLFWLVSSIPCCYMNALLYVCYLNVSYRLADTYYFLRMARNHYFVDLPNAVTIT